MKNFYMTLLSNSSMDYYPSNKTSSFTVHLPRYMYLEGDWEVSLVEIQYPYTFTNVESDQVAINIETANITADFILDWYTNKKPGERPPYETSWSTHNILSGFYSNVKDIVDALNEVIAEETGQVTFFEYDPYAQRVGCGNDVIEVGRKYISTFTLSPRLALQLGYIPHEIVTDLHKYAPNVANCGVLIPDKMLIYCDILEPQIIGDTWGKVLRIVSTNPGNSLPYFGQPCSISFNPPQYIPVQAHHFESIGIDIRDIAARPMPFSYGTLSVKLHFRKRIN